VTKPRAALPSKEELLRFIQQSPGRVAKRDIARAFGIKGGDRVRLKSLLRELADDGAIARGRRKLADSGRLPEVLPLEVIGRDLDGEALARPVGWAGAGPPPRIVLAAGRRGEAAPGIGDRVLARLARDERGYVARVVRRLVAAPTRVVGVLRHVGEQLRLIPSDRRQRDEFLVHATDAGGARAGELVVGEGLPGRVFGLPLAKVVERLGDAYSPRSFSIVAAKNQDLPDVFSRAALDEAEAARPATLAGREDLRALPLVTIDGADARDFDDAVHAAAEGDGHRITVAIADVAHYVRAGGALDREAHRRGNSVYFPDRVLPMLPEALSNELCSLKPGVDRAVLAVELRIDAAGNLLSHRFRRGLMRSAARLTYDQVQAARDSRPDDLTAPLQDRIIRPLYAAHAALLEARARRGVLELDLPERQVFLDPQGHVEAIRPRPRHQSHRLIEDMMIAANVAAAETLERATVACMYRIHDRPSADKWEGLAAFLRTLDLKLPPVGGLQARHLNRVLERVKGQPEERVVNEVMLRSQAQACYSPDNIGHFGLALGRYAHFTSPIRRYADLMVHRGLIRACRLGSDGLAEARPDDFESAAEHISITERRAAVAEREALDRYVTAFLAEREGATFAARISGATRFGLFVTLDETGADGLVPMASLDDDFYRHDERRHALVGRRRGRSFRLGDAVRVRLEEANRITGSLRFALVDKAGPGRKR